MNTTRELITSIEQAAEEIRERGFNPYAQMPAITIVEERGRSNARDMKVQVLCRQGITIGMVVTPAYWIDPAGTGRKLAVPPDEDGWALLDALLEAGVDNIQFWRIDGD